VRLLRRSCGSIRSVIKSATIRALRKSSPLSHLNNLAALAQANATPVAADFKRWIPFGPQIPTISVWLRLFIWSVEAFAVLGPASGRPTLRANRCLPRAKGKVATRCAPIAYIWCLSSCSLPAPTPLFKDSARKSSRAPLHVCDLSCRYPVEKSRWQAKVNIDKPVIIETAASSPG